jgi:cytochrome c biogenesis protein CcmG/thiol:disulfide interchange protein DsbE
VKRLPGLRASLVLLGTVGVLTLLAYGLEANRPNRSLDQAIAHGQRAPAPAVTLPTLGSGSASSLQALRGHVVVVNIWASWCGPCQSEAPVLQHWYGRIRRLGGTVVGIDTFDARSDATSFINKLHLTYPMWRDPEGQAKSKFGATGFPESFVIDRDGRVAAIERGPVKDAFMQGTVLPLLAEPA